MTMISWRRRRRDLERVKSLTDFSGHVIKRERGNEDSFSYDMWKELPDNLKMYNRVYYFNVTNAEEVERTDGRSMV